jgi:hypothetical protein
MNLDVDALTDSCIEIFAVFFSFGYFLSAHNGSFSTGPEVTQSEIRLTTSPFHPAAGKIDFASHHPSGKLANSPWVPRTSWVHSAV